MTEPQGSFDAVEWMRDIRDRMSEEMRDMSFEEQKLYIERHAEEMRKKLDSAKARNAA